MGLTCVSQVGVIFVVAVGFFRCSCGPLLSFMDVWALSAVNDSLRTDVAG